MEFNGLTSASHMSLPEAGYRSEEGQLGSEISGAVSGVTTHGASRLQASQLQERSATMQRLQVGGLVAVVAVLIAWPGLVLCWCAAPLLVGRAVLACPGLGSWRCSRLDARLALFVCCGICRRTASVVGCWLSVVFAWLGLVLCWCMPPPLLGRALFVPAPPPWWGVLCWCAPPPWWGVPRWLVAPLMVGHAVLVRGPTLGGACCVGACPPRWLWVAWVVVVCWVRCGCGCVVCLAWVGAVLVPGPLLLGRAMFLRAPPVVGACCVGVLGFRLVVL